MGLMKSADNEAKKRHKGQNQTTKIKIIYDQIFNI